MTMESLLLVATAVDLAALAALGWLVVRGARERELAGATQREALERLRAELTHLLDEAERRARALEGAAVPRGRAAAAAAADDRLRDTLVGDEPADDLAELRLRRELELSLGKARLA